MKTYVKPDVYYEDFELSTHVATCAYDMSDSQSVENCSFVGTDLGFPEDMHFFTNPDTCKDGELDEYCYTNGVEGYNVFNS